MPWLVHDGKVLATLEVATARPRPHAGPARARPGRRGAPARSGPARCTPSGCGSRSTSPTATATCSVLRVVTMRPNRIGLPVWKARSVIEAEAGSFERWGLGAATGSRCAAGRSRDRGALVLVATPIGNLGDLSPACDRGAGQGRRHRLRGHPAHRPPAASTPAYRRRLLVANEHTEASAAARGAGRRLDVGRERIVDRDRRRHAGDLRPGRAAGAGRRDGGHPVEVVPGPSAAIAALVVSGLPDRPLRLRGLPAPAGVAPHPAAGRAGRRAAHDRPLRGAAPPCPHARRPRRRARAAAAGGGIARELTKLHEEVWRGTLAEAVERAAGRAPGRARPGRRGRSGAAGGRPTTSWSPPLAEAVGGGRSTRRMRRRWWPPASRSPAAGSTTWPPGLISAPSTRGPSGCHTLCTRSMTWRSSVARPRRPPSRAAGCRRVRGSKRSPAHHRRAAVQATCRRSRGPLDRSCRRWRRPPERRAGGRPAARPARRGRRTRQLDLRSRAIDQQLAARWAGELARVGDLVTSMQRDERAEQHGQIAAGLAEAIRTTSDLAGTTQALRTAVWPAPRPAVSGASAWPTTCCASPGFVEGVNYRKQTARRRHASPTSRSSCPTAACCTWT